jgi:hypothetical protein
VDVKSLKKFLVVKKDHQMYEVWADNVLVKECTQLRYALDYVQEHQKEASFKIKYPDGRTHNWNDKETPSA